MGFNFSNDWPYSDSTFPSMDDHVDPVNNVYFTGLHQAVGDIQYFLGLNPEKGYADVAQKLTLHDHSGGDKGAVLPMAQYAWHVGSISTPDFHITTYDNNVHDVDMSPYVPAGTTAIHVRIQFTLIAAGMRLAVYMKGEGSASKYFYIYVHTAEIMYCHDCVIRLDANRKLSWQWTGGTDTIDFWPSVLAYIT